MALRTPPSWLQNGSHPADNDRLTTQALYSTTGVVGSTSLAISAQVSPNMTVNAAAGWCAVAGSSANSGVYVAYNDAPTVLTITTAPPSLPRIDRIVVTIQDAFYSGAANTVIFQVLAGTPAASPSAPATPSDSISLATIAVAAAASTITAGNITDTRVGATSNAFLPLTGGTVSGATAFSSAITFAGTVSASNTIVSTSTIAATSFLPSAGTTTVAPLRFTSGTNLTTPQAGAFEYNGSTAYLTPVASLGRAVLAADYYYQLGTTFSLSNVSTPQSMFGVGITLTTGRYEYEIVARVASGSTAHNTDFNVLGTVVFGAPFITYSNSSQGSAVATTTVVSTSTISATLFAGTSTATTTGINLRGMFRVSTAGTFIPAIQFSVAPGGSNSTAAGSFIRLRRVDDTAGTAATVIGAWA